MRGIEQVPWLYDALMAVAEAAGFRIEPESRRARNDMRRFSARRS